MRALHDDLSACHLPQPQGSGKSRTTPKVLARALALLACLVLPWVCASAQGPFSLQVGAPTTDANGVKSYPVLSDYQPSEVQTVRVLEPTNPAPGKPQRVLYVLPVESGVDGLSSSYSDGLEELRLLDVPNRFNMTLIAPSFNYVPWYGDNVVDPSRRMESFIVDDLVPWGDSFLQNSPVPQRYLIGFSKSGFGALELILRHPAVFNAAAIWDSPAQLSSLSAFDGLSLNFGTQQNLDRYNIPSLILGNPGPFQTQNRLWISGDQAEFTAAMSQLNDQLTAQGMQHTWVAGPVRVHNWGSGWLDGAVSDLDAHATLTAPLGGTPSPVLTGGLPTGVLQSGTTQATLRIATDENASCRYATSAGVAYGAMSNTFSSTGGVRHQTQISGLADGGSYSYFVRCQGASGTANTDDYAINFSVGVAASNGGSASSSFSGTEAVLWENGMWATPGAWANLSKSDGAYATGVNQGARLVTPLLGANQYAEITYDQDPGSGTWTGVMTRVQGANNGGGYLAIAFAGQVRLYRADDNGSLDFFLLAAANTNLSVTPRQLRLESQGTLHKVYFNGVLLLTRNDSKYSAGQPGIAESVFGGPTVKITSFAAGTLAATQGDVTPPQRTGGQPSNLLPSGTTQATLSLSTDENATCRYATTAGTAYAAMSHTFSSTGGVTHQTQVTGLADGGNYSYFVRCQDGSGNANPDDYTISFSVATAGSAGSANSSFLGSEAVLSENGMWATPGAWGDLSKSNGAYATGGNQGARLMTPLLESDQYAEINYDQDPGSSTWTGVMTRIPDAGNGSGYLAIAFAGQVRLYRADDTGSLDFTLLGTADTNLSVAPRLLRLESQGTSHRVYFNGVLLLTITDGTYTSGQPGIAESVFGGPTVKITSFAAGTLAATQGDVTPPLRTGGQPSNLLPSGTTQATLSLSTDENATCRYATTAGTAYAAMSNIFSSTGGLSHQTPVTGLADGGNYSYFVRCQDGSGNANPDDYTISFSVATAGSGGGSGTSNFLGNEAVLSENGMWATPGAWGNLSKSNGAYATGVNQGSRLVTPLLGADQYAEINYDQDPGSSSWTGVMTRVQGANNGGGYLAIAFAGQVRLYRADDTGSLDFYLLAAADTDLSVAPRQLRLESQGSTHRVYFNGVLLLTASEDKYTAGQPGIAEAVFGGPTVKITSFSAGGLN